MTRHTPHIMLSVACAWATACEGPPEQVTPEPEPPPAVSIQVHDELLGKPAEAPEPPEPPKDMRIAHARAHAKCYEMDGREGTFACALHRAGRDTPFVFNKLLLGDVSAMHSFSEPVYMSGAKPSPTPRSAVTIELSSRREYERPPRGWRAREEARRKGHTYRADHATGEFFTEGPERRYDQGQAPLFMRKEDVAALRCGDTLYRFTKLSDERTQRLFDQGVFEIRMPPGRDLPHGPELTWVKGKGSTREGFPESSSRYDPCGFLLGPADAKEKRKVEALRDARKELGDVEKLQDVRWCIDTNREEPWADPNAHATMRERMGEGVARDATELARRLHAIIPEGAEPHREDDFLILTSGLEGLAPDDLKPIYKWWSRLDYGAPREAARIEVVTSLYGTTPRSLRLENHTKEGKRFRLEFSQCAHHELRSREEREGLNRRRKRTRTAKEGR